MNRVEQMREHINVMLATKKDAEDKRVAYLHLYGVAFACALIAKKRKANVELAVMAGMLHDLYSYKKKDEVNHDPKKVPAILANHAKDGAVFTRELLNEWQLTTPEETDAICTAIYNHSDKHGKFAELDEILIDADVLQHCLYNPAFPVAKHEESRFNKLMQEFGIESRG
ncbi:MAG: HD domain-containing protein [Defluviitaleaceae bacterium]|nr:HD domain-containing protein [Defluviitaleaceae bacterium]MCL2274002.1 HD domain-containing protein [Defluviitaleaceae bacterium]MCL2274097.1 HD domain-containing protein [Defluviitaleaceae bacterium]